MPKLPVQRGAVRTPKPRTNHKRRSFLPALLLFVAAVSFVVGSIFRSGSLVITPTAQFLDQAWKIGQKPTSPLQLQDNGHINDRTLRLSPHVEHVWLQNTAQPPNLKIVLTDFGWNHPDRATGLTFPRSLRSRELMEGVLNHPNFDPTFQWSQESPKVPSDNNIQYVIFLDVETCFESNYPLYGKGCTKNLDAQFERQLHQHAEHTNDRSCYQYDQTKCRFLEQALQSPLFQSLQDKARLVVFNCRGAGVDASFRADPQTPSQLSIAAVSATPNQLNPQYDLGLPPPAVHPIRLSSEQRAAIHSCQGEDDPIVGPGHRFGYFLTCIATVQKETPTRRKLYDLFHNPDQGIILMQPIPFRTQFPHLHYHQVMQESVFSATPRGDNLFSYRFTEVMSSGSIPVVLADGWVLPFHNVLVDWRDCAVLIPEARVAETMDILKAITPAERCQRRRTCQEIYQRYMASPEGTIAGIVEVLQRMMDHNKPPTDGPYSV